ncbi:MAG: protease inhibitor I42 family protein [Dehalococcoidia bacterium]|nr:protease inhibitor I42 family protein [Dehalococcoidia bacterium]
MNRKLAWLFPAALAGLLAVSLSTAACGDDDDDDDNGGAPNEVQLSKADNGKTVTVAMNGTVIVALASNPSTGYSWAVVATEPANLELEGEPTYVPPGSTTPVVGAAGTEVFTFKAIRTGSSKLSMAYARSFETGVAPVETFEVTVEVE